MKSLHYLSSSDRRLFGIVTEVICCCLCAGWRVGVSVLSAASADKLHQRFWEHQTGSRPLPEQPAGPIFHPPEASRLPPHLLHLIAKAGVCLSGLNEFFSTQVFHCLNEILELCQSFCSMVSQSMAPLDERGTAQLDLLVKVEPLASSPTLENTNEYFYLQLCISIARASDVSLHCCSKSSRVSGTIKLTQIWLSCFCGWTTTNTIHRLEGPWAGRSQVIRI